MNWFIRPLTASTLTFAYVGEIVCIVSVTLTAFKVIADDDVRDLWRWARSWFAPTAKTNIMRDTTEADRHVAALCAQYDPGHFPEARAVGHDETDPLWNVDRVLARRHLVVASRRTS